MDVDDDQHINPLLKVYFVSNRACGAVELRTERERERERQKEREREEGAVRRSQTDRQTARRVGRQTPFGRRRDSRILALNSRIMLKGVGGKSAKVIEYPGRTRTNICLVSVCLESVVSQSTQQLTHFAGGLLCVAPLVDISYGYLCAIRIILPIG